MRNIRLTLAYDGTHYVGWQVQPNGVSVQSVVETALLKLTGTEIRVTAAGRTDSGVHALGQVANFTTESAIPCDNFRSGLQNFLPDDVVVRDVDEVAADFHATYAAKSKTYRYLIHNSRIPLPQLRHFAWRYSATLDEQAMQLAANVLLGQHDFRCFESHFPNRATSVRTITGLNIVRRPIWSLWNSREIVTGPLSVAETSDSAADLIVCEITADGFLYNMVRAIVGTLIKVGIHSWTADDVARIVVEGERSKAGETAPAHGLYLVEVVY